MSRERSSWRGQHKPLARYANYFEVGHNAYEFLIDFGQFQPETSDVLLHTRMALGPAHAKLLDQILHDAVAKYEDEHGSIVIPHQSMDALEALLRSFPDFERRAVNVQRASATEAPVRARRSPQKR
jgi:hypothetical protein